MSFLRNTLFVFSALSLPNMTYAQAEPKLDPDAKQTTVSYGDWNLQCVSSKEKKEECVIYQVVLEPNDKAFQLIRMALGYFDSDKLGVVISAPLGVALIPGIEVKVRDTEAAEGKDIQVSMTDKNGKETREDVKGLSYERCFDTSCISGFPIDKIEIERFKRAKSIEVTVFGIDAANKAKGVISMVGFNAAFDAMIKKSK